MSAGRTGAAPAADTGARPEVRLATQVAHVLDTYRAAPIVGMLLPGVGDVLCGLVGLGVVGLAAARRVPGATLARMCLNLAVMVGVGAVPLVGDAFVFWFRGNERNVRLLARADGPGHKPWRDAAALALAGVLLLATLVLTLVGLVFAVRWGLGRA